MSSGCLEATAEARICSIPEIPPIGIPLGLCNEDHRYVAVNTALAAINGVPASHHVGKKPAELRPELGRKIEPFLRRVARSAQPLVDVPIHALLGEERREWLVSVYPVNGEGPARTAYVLLDITDYRYWHRLLDRPAPARGRHKGSNRVRLTRREREVLEWIGHGKTSKEIAAGLGMSVLTVGNHRKQICRKLGLHTTAELAAYAAKQRVLGESDAGLDFVAASERF